MLNLAFDTVRESEVIVINLMKNPIEQPRRLRLRLGFVLFNLQPAGVVASVLMSKI